ncbi:MAG: T9SS type A sorting domain-containing protein [Chitinophagaceae bacterium]|nr:MAG: T9SS type A sorting domain-containing protein [Chitinophagaceae bacterium]
MRKLYTPILFLLLPILFLSISYTNSYGQCNDPRYGDQTSGIAFDTSFAIPAGNTSMPIYLPKFNPEVGMVNCMRLCLTITGVVDSLSFENNQVANHTYSASYSRLDVFNGPGLASPIFNSDSKNYTFPLQTADGVPGSGVDFGKVVRDTVLNAKSTCITITDVGVLSQFYGVDSLVYNYMINAGVSISSGGNASIGIATSGLVNIRFEYCYCPAVVLPVSIHAFDLNKLNESKVDLSWSGYDESYDDYYYEAEVSRDGKNFTSISSVARHADSNDPYTMTFTSNGDEGVYHFRIRQVYANGYVRYSNTKQVVLGKSLKTKFLLYPNPSSGIVGIKFDNTLSGVFNALIYTTQGQMTVQKEIMVKPGSSYTEIARLVPGVYWLRLTDKKSLESSVHQILIK